MKIRTKFLAAVLATATAFSCALTASALSPTPSITLDNTTVPATLQGNTATATLTLTSTNFEDVRGAKITIKFPENVKLENAKITDSTWTENQDYKVDENTVTLVDVFNIDSTTKTDLSLNLEVTVSNVTTWDNIGNITVSGEFADSKVDQVIKLDSCGTGTIVIGRQETSASDLETLNNSISDSNDYFIPYGGAYIGATNLRKNTDGTFKNDGNVSGDIGVLKCKLPVGEAVTTFGVSKGLENLNPDGTKAIQFGSYVNDVKSGYTYGTLFIAPGNVSFEEAVKYYKENTTYKTEAAILGRFIKILTNPENNAEANTLHTIKFNGGAKSIKVAYVPQNNYMWKDSAKGVQCSKLQYAVRYKLTDDKLNTEYTAAGYYCNAEGTYNFSTEIKSSSYNDIPDVQ